VQGPSFVGGALLHLLQNLELGRLVFVERRAVQQRDNAQAELAVGAGVRRLCGVLEQRLVLC